MKLLKPVNFSGHYRVIISKNGTLPQDCGNDGWIIDRLTGEIVSELPEFNGNTKYLRQSITIHPLLILLI